MPKAVQNLVEVREDNNKFKLPVDCQHHLRNFWSKNSSMKLCNHVKLELEEDSRGIDFHLRFKVDMGSIIRSVDKYFNLSSEYPKEDGDAFKAFIE